MTTKNIVLSHSDKLFVEIKKSRKPVPPRGWIHFIRTSLGMTLEQLGRRLNLPKSNVSQIQSHEVSGTVTLNTLKKVAEALDCEFYYAFLPKSSLRETVKKQAQRYARKHLESVSVTMALEAQDVAEGVKREQFEELVEELVRTGNRRIWDEG